MKKMILYFTGVVASLSQLWGNPENPIVVSGTANFDSSHPQRLEIVTSDRAIIHWDVFSIEASETTYFALPDNTSTVLNRVSSSFPSTLAGMLQSNGQVYLINPNGILVTQDGIINTAGFLASTLNVLDDQFLNGGDLLFTGDSLASVINLGQITAWNGDVILLGCQIENQHLMTSNQGVVGLGSGQSILLTPSKDQRIAIQIGPQVSSDIGINNTGIIKAIQAELKTLGNFYGLAIQQEGLISATSSQVVDGRIYLIAEGGTASVIGDLIATGFDVHGGEIQVLGDKVLINDSSQINASGFTGGGRILIGGSYQGSDPSIIASEFTFVDGSVNIKANASGPMGDGGEVVIWSNGSTYFFGKIQAEAALLSGNGGSVEVSGVNYLDFQGLVSTRAPNGTTGTLLLDPTDITINAAGPTNATFNMAPCGVDTYCGGALASATIKIDDLLAQLLLTNVIVDSSQGTGAGTGTITLDDPLTIPAGSHSLTWNARTNIVLNASITNNSSGSVALNSGTGASGNIAFTVQVSPVSISNTSSGNFSLTAGSSAANVGTITTSTTSMLTNSGSGNMLLNARATGTAINIQGPISHSSTGTFQVSTLQGNITTLPTATINLTAGSGAMTWNAAGSSGLPSLTFAGPIISAASSNFQALATLGNISFSSSATLSFTGGSPIFIQASGGSVTMTSTTMSFSGAGGSLTLSAQGALSINGAITDYSYPGTCWFISNTATITTSSGANMTFNSGAGNVNFFAPQGSISTNSTPTLLFNAGARNLTFRAGTAGMFAGSITSGSTITFNSGMGKSLTMNANGSIALGNINYGSSGDCSITTTGPSGIINNIGGTPVLNWGPSGAIAGSLFLHSSTTIQFNVTAIFSSTSGNSPTAFSLVAPGLIIWNVVGSTNFNFSSPYDFVITSTDSGGGVAIGAPVTFNAGAGSLLVTVHGTTGNTSIFLDTNMNYSTSSPALFLATTGFIAVHQSIVSNDGAPFTFQTSDPAGLLMISANMAYSGGAGPLTINAGGQLILDTGATLAHSYSSVAQITSSNSSILSNSLLNFSGAGGLTMNAFTGLTITGSVLYSAASAFSLISQTSSITVNGAISLNTSAPFSMSTTPGGTDILIGNLVQNSSTGTMSVSSQRDFIIGIEENLNDYQFGSAGGDLSISAVRDVIVNGLSDLGTSATNAQIGYHTGDINSNIVFINIGRDLIVQAGTLSSALIGHGSFSGSATGGTRNGDIIFGSMANPIGRNVLVSGFSYGGSSVSSGDARIGHVPAPVAPVVNATGNIDMRFVSGEVTVRGGAGGSAFIGHGGSVSIDATSFTGNIQVHAVGNITVDRPNSFGGIFTGIGHAGSMISPAVSTTLASSLIEVISDADISVSSSESNVSFIGLVAEYVGTVGSSTVSGGQITVQTGVSNSLTLAASTPTTTSSNGVIVGAMAFTGNVPFVSAGTASANLTVGAGEDVILLAGLGGSAGTSSFAVITNGINTSGAFDVTVSSGGGTFIQGGTEAGKIAGISSIRNMDLTAGGDLQIFSDGGQGFITSAANLIADVLNIYMQGTLASPRSTIQTVGGTMDLTAGNVNLNAHSLVSSFSTLTGTISGELFLGPDTAISSLASYTIDVGGTALLSSGASALITSVLVGDLTVADNIYILADPLGTSGVTSGGDLSVASTAGSIYLIGTPALQNAVIASSTGSLAVSAAEEIVLLDSGELAITGGSGALSVTAAGQLLLKNGSSIFNTGTGTVTLSATNASLFNASTISAASTGLLTLTTLSGDLSIYNNSLISNSGSGGVNASVNKTLYMESGPLGTTAITVGAGGGVITANGLVMSGVSIGNTALISGSGGTLSISSTTTAFLNPFSSISMSGMIGNIMLSVGADLLIAENSSIQNNAAIGTASLSIMADAVFLNGSSFTGNGPMSLAVMGNLFTAGATMSSSDSLSLISAKDIVLTEGSQIIAVLDLSLSAARNLAFLNGAFAHQTSMGAAGVSFTATSGEFTLLNGSAVQSDGTNGMTGSIGKNALIEAGSLGGSFIAVAGALSITAGGNLDVIAASGNSGSISSSGLTTIESLNVNLIGSSAMMNAAFIENNAGSLTIMANSVSLQDIAHIAITAGTGTLTINASMGDLRIGNGCFVQNQGTGSVIGSINKALLLTAGANGNASLLSGIGGINMSAGCIVLEGASSLNRALISVAGGPFSLSSTLETILTSHADIELTGGMDAFQLIAGSDLFAGGDTLIQNSGSGNTTVSIKGAMEFYGTSEGSAVIQGGTGDFTLTATDSIRLLASASSDASILSLGNLSVTSNQDVFLVGSSSMNTLAINTITGTLTVEAKGNLAARDRARILLTAGTGLLTAKSAKDFFVENGASIEHSGTGNIVTASGSSLMLRSGSLGDAFIAGLADVNVSSGALLNIESLPGTHAYVSGFGNIAVSAGSALYLFDGTITSTLGTLNISSSGGNCLAGSLIEIGMGSSGILTLISMGDFRLANGCRAQNLGSGAISSSISGNLYVEQGPLGISSIVAGSGGGVIDANALILNGGFLTAAEDNFTVTSRGSISLNPASGIFLLGGSGILAVNAQGDLLVLNGSNISNSGSGTTNINVNGVATIQGGNLGSSSIEGDTGDLSLIIGDNLHLLSDAGGSSSITSQGNIFISSGADISLLGAAGMMLGAKINSASGSLNLTARNNIFLSDVSAIVISSGANTLSFATVNGDMYVQNGSFIEQQGTGPLEGNIKRNIYIKAGFEGDAFVSINGPFSLTAGGDMSLEAAPLGSAYIQANGAASIAAARLLMMGYDAVNAAYITNASGALTVSSGMIDMLDNAYIALTMGLGTLSVKATAGNFSIANGSYVQHMGSGLLSIESNNGTLYLEAGILGAGSLLGNTGGATVSAGAILMNGVSNLSQAQISAAQGTLSVATSKMLNLTPFSEIVLLGGAGPLNYTVGGNLYLGDNTLIHNFGSGATNPVVSGITYICH